MKEGHVSIGMKKSLILDIWYVKMFMKNAGGEGDILHVLNKPRT